MNQGVEETGEVTPVESAMEAAAPENQLGADVPVTSEQLDGSPVKSEQDASHVSQGVESDLKTEENLGGDGDVKEEKPVLGTEATSIHATQVSPSKMEHTDSKEEEQKDFLDQFGTASGFQPAVSSDILDQFENKPEIPKKEDNVDEKREAEGDILDQSEFMELRTTSNQADELKNELDQQPDNRQQQDLNEDYKEENSNGIGDMFETNPESSRLVQFRSQINDDVTSSAVQEGVEQFLLPTGEVGMKTYFISNCLSIIILISCRNHYSKC